MNLPKTIYVAPREGTHYIGDAYAEPTEKGCEEYIKVSDLIGFINSAKLDWQEGRKVGDENHKKGRIRAYNHIIGFIKNFEK